MNDSHRPIGTALVVFMLSGFMSLILLTAAFVAWLSTLIGSTTVASLIVGLFFLIIAVIVYRVALHSYIESMRRRFDTIYEVSRIVEGLYRRTVEFIEKIVG
ncbi:MAG: phage holin family protein [Alistipes sp.]|nr:phage holin family protein [Alistipes sp.]MDE6861151.1 phage holin family protein [Alistipes sp.]